MKSPVLAFVLCVGAAACGGETASAVAPSSLSAGGTSAPNTTVPNTGTPPTGGVTPLSGRLAFTSDRDGAFYIYTSVGSDLRRLTPGSRPKWSPNGAQLVFQVTSPSVGVYVINADGSGLRYLTQGVNPSWSPDGTRIVFSYGDLSTEGLFVINADGSNRSRIVDGYAIGAFPQSAAWSPDGRTIAFIRANYDEPWQLHLVAPDGTSLRPLYHPSGGIFTQDQPEWSPDGSQFVFHSISSVTVSNVDGSGWHAVAEGLGPDWIPAGFVYARKTGPGPTFLGGWEHRLFALEGGVERQVVPDAAVAGKYSDFDPDWTR